MSNVEVLGGLQRRLNVSIPQQQFRGDVESRLKDIGRTAKVHGFRPGKVPLQVLEKQYGAAVQREVLDESLRRSFYEATVSNKLQVAGYPEFEIKTADLSAPQIEYSATFEVFPEVTLGNVSGEQVKRFTFTLSDADVEETINTLRKQRAEYQKVERAAGDGDRVRIDFTGKLDGQVFQGGEAKDFTLQLGAGRMLPDFEKAITGMKAGETKSFDMTFPADYHGKDVAGKQVNFTIVMHAVEEAKLPEVDAEFVKSVGVADGDLAKFREEIKANIGREAQNRAKTRNKEAVMEVLLKVSTLEVPKALIENEARNMQEQAIHDMESRGVRIPKGMSLPPDMFTEGATKRVKMGLILSELVKQHGLQAKPEQVEALVREYAQSYEDPENVVRWYYGNPSRLAEVENLVVEDNVVDWVMGAAKVADQSVTLNELMGSN